MFFYRAVMFEKNEKMYQRSRITVYQNQKNQINWNTDMYMWMFVGVKFFPRVNFSSLRMQFESTGWFFKKHIS
jgi:hypothetical protein